VAIGALFFLNNLHIIYWREWFAYWPVILIAAGIVKLVDSAYAEGRVAGGILVGLGAIFLAQTLGFLQFRMRVMWPLLLIGLGLLLLFQRAHAWQPPDFWKDRTVKANVLNEVVIFGGGKRVVSAADFQGGTIQAIFGGLEIDLRHAGIAGESATLDVSAVFGGVEIKIPQSWNAVVEGVGIFGGYADETMHPDSSVTGVKSLILKGAAVFGGVEVKN